MIFVLGPLVEYILSLFSTDIVNLRKQFDRFALKGDIWLTICNSQDAQEVDNIGPKPNLMEWLV